jgi:hypothetical protein
MCRAIVVGSLLFLKQLDGVGELGLQTMESRSNSLTGVFGKIFSQLQGIFDTSTVGCSLFSLESGFLRFQRKFCLIVDEDLDGLFELDQFCQGRGVWLWLPGGLSL